jgi:leucyl-tRNA synthetase
MPSYNPSKIEKKWQKAWATKKLSVTRDRVEGKENKMVLVEFPYPSGNLHMGHWYAFALPDIYARYWRMRGYNVMYPIGFDAFGLPAENAAIQRNIHPEKWTKQNIAYMTKQLVSMGTMFDFSRVVSTIDPAYYRWTQWMFLKMFERKLAYRATTMVNWCPKDKTVLANEQVVDGSCERCGTTVQQRLLEQWMMRTTAFADSLIDDLRELDWPHATRVAQQNWIGRSDGALVRWNLRVPGQPDDVHHVETFTTRPDTIFGVTCLVISPELAKKWTDVGWQPSATVKNYVSRALGRRELDRMEAGKDKTGVATGIHAVHPLTGELLPVWVSDYVLGSYGTGAIMAVPAHDGRDFEFATTFQLAIKQVIVPADGAHHDLSTVFAEEGILVNSGPYNGRSSSDAKSAIAKKLHDLGMGGPKRTYKLRDWVLSRQRYWGVPIPIINCPTCGHVPVPESQLPVKLPPLKDFKPADDGRSPLAKATAWLKVKCPTCKGPAERETDTMDTFVDSSWYYLRYTDPTNTKKFADPAAMKAWLPVSIYIGGAEHNTMHLLYSRFFAHALHDMGHLSFSEPFLSRRNHGIILGPDGQKMSKSRGNVVDPDKEVAQFGSDTVRMYLAFMAPYEQGGPWDPKGINGVYRFLTRVFKLYQKKADKNASAGVERALHAATKKIGVDIDALSLNTCVSELMKLINTIEEADCALTELQRERFLLLLAPLAPHLAEELWQGVLKKKTSIHKQSWPSYDSALLVLDEIQMPVQVNGKLRGLITVPVRTGQEEALRIAKEDPNIAKYIEGFQIRKTIFIPGKLMNLVVS